LGDALSAPAGQDADFLASLKGRKDEVSGLTWPEAIRLRIGYENVRLDLEEKFLRNGANGRPVIITLAGEEQSGKTTLVYWLAASLTRLGRQCIYADFGGDSLKYWEVLRLIRDGRLDSGIDADVAFNRFNYALNVRQVDGYEKAHPHPPAEGVAVAEEEPEADLALFMQETGTVEAEDDPLSAIIATFWSDLKRLSGEKGLVVFFDHVERMTLSEVQIIYRHLLRPALDVQDHKVQFVIVREISPFMTNLVDSWESLKQQNKLLEHYILPGFPGQETLWFSRVWARRYYQLVCDYQLGQNNQLGHNNLIRAFLNQNPGVSLKIDRLDDLLAQEPSLEPSTQPVPPGQIVDFLVGVKIVSRYLKKLTGE
jgi:hypothetical protein